jgi:hypothetical protein
MKLTRIQCLIAGCALILLVYMLGRLNYTIGSKKVTGKFVFYISEDLGRGEQSVPIIEYLTADSICQFRGDPESVYQPGEEVPVLLRRGDSEQPMLYSISAFWLQPLVFYILPLALWTAFVLSYISKYETVITVSNFPYFKKVRTKDLK